MGSKKAMLSMSITTILPILNEDNFAISFAKSAGLFCFAKLIFLTIMGMSEM